MVKKATKKTAKKIVKTAKTAKTTRQTSFDKAVSAGVKSRPKWAAAPRLKSKGAYTWYASLLVRQDIYGGVSDVVKVSARAPPRLITVALLGVVRSGKRSGELRKITGAEFERHFDRLLRDAIRRHGLVPSGRNFVKSVFRHKEN